MFDFLDDAFYDWNAMSFVVWIGLSLGIIYVAWFVKIPSAMGSGAGFPFLTKAGVTIFIPIITYFLIRNKEWTAQTFRKRSK